MRLGVLDVGSNTVHLLGAGRGPRRGPGVGAVAAAGRGPAHPGQRLTDDPPARSDLEALAGIVDDALAPIARHVKQAGPYDLAVGTSKTFRSLARLAGAAPSSAGLRARRTLTGAGLRQLFGFISRMAAADLAALDGVSPGRAHQLVAGALVGGSAMRALEVNELQICPWALREGVIQPISAILELWLA